MDGQILKALQKSVAATALFRDDDSIAFISSSYREILSVPTEARTFSDIVRHCKETSTGLTIEGEVDEWLARANKTRRSVGARTFETDTQDGRWFLISETTLEDRWLWVVLTDITFLKSTESMLRLARDIAQRDALTDELTGLYNRRYAMAELDTILGRDNGLAIGIIDIDFFKKINDSWGHDAGDKVLQAFADLGRQAIGRHGKFCRIGGEEFLAILPACRADTARGLMDELRAQVQPIAYRNDEIAYSFSAGIADVIQYDPKDLLRAADNALYLAKERGRNCTVVANPSNQSAQALKFLHLT